MLLNTIFTNPTTPPPSPAYCRSASFCDDKVMSEPSAAVASPPSPPISPCDERLPTATHGPCHQPDTPEDIAADADLTANEKLARSAVRHAVRNCPHLATSYAVETVIGFGSNGVVLRARPLNRPAAPSIALKIIHRASWSPEDDEGDEPQEVSVLRWLAQEDAARPHPGLPRYIDSWDDGHQHYLITDLIAGVAVPPTRSTPSSLLTFRDGRKTHRIPLDPTDASSDLWSWSLRRTQQPQNTQTTRFTLPHVTYALNPPPLPEVQPRFATLASALHHLHARGVAHLDIKEENVLMSREGGCVLADLGHSRRADARVGAYGTREMTPPELLCNVRAQAAAAAASASASPRDGGARMEYTDASSADVFALGMVLFSMLHGPSVLPEAVEGTVRKGHGLGLYLAEEEEEGVDSAQGFYPLGAMRWDVIDGEGDVLGLLRGMTMRRVEERWGMEEVMAHPWVQGGLSMEMM
ncbi:hypothetical protein HK101_007041 [Irineochytrium annulatum]|nr:hypothetical protein HK101_007041 [Irineochytrium annulatum]